MLRKRGSGGELPTTFNGGPSKLPDGSGKSIKMEAPLAKAIRSADGFMKGTYIWFFISTFFIWGGWSWIRRNSSSIVLDCGNNSDNSGCTLTLQAPYSFLPRNSSTGIPVKTRSRSKRRTKIKLERDQVVRADNIKWNPVSQTIVENYGLNSPTYASHFIPETDQNEDNEAEGGPNRPNKPWNEHKRKHKAKGYKKKGASYNRNGGPDADGNYDSYILVLRDPLPPSFESDEGIDESDPDESPSMKMQKRMAAQHRSMTDDPNSLATLLAPFAITDGSASSTEYIIHPRDFNVGQTRRLARTAVSKIVAYTKGRRASCILRESRPVAWQGLVLLILGIFSLVLCLLLGQFWEEHDPTKQGSYRKRMAEIRRREEAKKLRQRKSVGRKGVVRRPGGAQPALRRPEGARGTTAKKVEDSATSRISSSGSVRARPNAGASKTRGGDSWVGSGGGAAHAYTKRAY